MSVSNREGIDKRLAQLHEQGTTMVEAIKAMVIEFDLDLSEAKQIAAAHPSWRGIANAAQPLHDDLEILAKRRK